MGPCMEPTLPSTLLAGLLRVTEMLRLGSCPLPCGEGGVSAAAPARNTQLLQWDGAQVPRATHPPQGPMCRLTSAEWKTWQIIL